MSECAYEQFFKEADKDGSGTLSFNELCSILRSKGYRGDEGELRALFDKADTGDDNKISYDEYVAAMAEAPPATHKGARMRQLFAEFDKDGSGEITQDELKASFAELQRILTEKEAERMVHICDTDCSGTINYNEFIKKVFGQ